MKRFALLIEVALLIDTVADLWPGTNLGGSQVCYWMKLRIREACRLRVAGKYDISVTAICF